MVDLHADYIYREGISLRGPHIQIAGARSLHEIESLDNSFRPAFEEKLRCAIGLVYGESEHLNEKVLEDSVIAAANSKVRYSNLVLISYFNGHRQIIDAVEKTGVRYLQLHGPIAVEEIVKARQVLGDIFLIKSLPIAIDIHPEKAFEESFGELRVMEPYVDCFITDTRTMVDGVLRFGATGVVHPWELSRKLVKSSSKPVIIAGGLTPQNVQDAIKATMAYGVDVHSGVEDIDSSSIPALRNKSKILVDSFVQEALKGLSLN